MTPQAILTVYVAAVGLVVGSYLNVLIHRLPRGLSTVTPRSRCPHCRSAIRPWHNVPVFGYLLLGGRCRDCRRAIHWRYPLVELLTCVCFVACLKVFGPRLDALAAAAFCAVVMVLAAIDLEHLLLPDRLTYPGIALGLLLSPWLSFTDWRGAVLGAALGAGALLLVAGAWHLLHGVAGLGLGDVKMMAMVGAFLGLRGVAVTLFVGSLTGSAVGLAGMLTGRLDSRSRLPFGFFLGVGALVALFFGARLWDAYRGLAPAIGSGFR